MFATLARVNLLRNQSRLYSNRVQLAREETISEVEDGTPVVTTTLVPHWTGMGSIQYVRPRIQKAIASENQGMMEDPISLVAYVPYDAQPDDSMMIIDVDGVVGTAGRSYIQSRKPANVGGLNVYWEIYLGLGVND
jgi:hypothetical protein